MGLNYTELEKAIVQLNKGLNNYQKYKDNDELYEMARDSLIQRFEFTYELSNKMLAKCLRELGYEKAKADVDNKKVLWRTATQTGHITKYHNWVDYKNHRNTTSHEYDEKFVAEEEFIIMIDRFAADASQLLHNMRTIEL